MVSDEWYVVETTYPMPPRPNNDILDWEVDLRGCRCSFSRMAVRPTKVPFLGYGTRTKAHKHDSVQKED